MRKMAWLTGILTCLMLLLAAAGAVCGAVVHQAGDPLLYGAQSRAAVRDAMGLATEDAVTAYIGLDAQQQDALAQQIAGGMAAEDALFELDALNAREQQHLRDVHGLMQLAGRATKLCLTLAAALAVVIAWTGARLAKRRRTVLLGLLGGALALAAIAGVGALAAHTAGFEAAFIRLHQLLFANELWIMDPETDVLIRMMPQLLFERAAVLVAKRACGAFAVICALLLAVYAIVGGMIRRNLSEREKA